MAKISRATFNSSVYTGLYKHSAAKCCVPIWVCLCSPVGVGHAFNSARETCTMQQVIASDKMHKAHNVVEQCARTSKCKDVS